MLFIFYFPFPRPIDGQITRLILRQRGDNAQMKTLNLASDLQYTISLTKEIPKLGWHSSVMPSVSRSLSLRQQCSQGFAYTRRALSLCCSCFPGAIAGRQEKSPLLHDPVMFYSDGKQPYYYVIIILEDCSVLSLSLFFIIWQKETLSIPIKFVTVRVTMESGRFSIMKTEFISVLLL